MKKSKKIILELDSYFPDKLYQWFSANNYAEKHDLYILTKPAKSKILKSKLSDFQSLNYITYDDIFSYTTTSVAQTELYHDFVKFYFNDHITARFIDRAGYNPKYGIGVQNAFAHQANLSYNVLMFLQDHNFDCICFRNTPHDSEEWLLAKAFEFLDIDIYTFEDFIFPWLYTIKKGYYKERKLVYKDISNISRQDLKKHIDKYVSQLSGNYETAMPSYEKERLGKGLFKFYNPFKNKRLNFRTPYRFINKTKNYFFYKKHAKPVDFQAQAYAVFFLHFQPERSTLPDGFDFVDQFYTISILRQLFPKNIKILVKEHPSMFTRYSHTKFRNLCNYKAILNLENTDLVSMHTNSFDLIDNAMVVMTIKGTVALESYIRKKPVIMFGKSNLCLKGVHNFNTIKDLENFIRLVLQDKIQLKDIKIELLNACYGVSVSGLESTADKIKDYSYNKTMREVASLILLSNFMSKIEE
jgi:hypothetical protein